MRRNDTDTPCDTPRDTPDIRLNIMGSFIFMIALLFIAVLNGMLLRCFYRLRDQKFVKNSKFVVILIGSDLVGTLVLIPAVLNWFFVLPSESYTTCVLKALPFWVMFHLRVHSMFAFCLHRVVVICAVTRGANKLWCKFRELPVTISLWVISLVLTVMPVVVLGNVQRIQPECDRSMFPSWVFGYLSIVFDIPVVGMNISFIVLLVWLRKFNTVSVTLTSKATTNIRANEDIPADSQCPRHVKTPVLKSTKHRVNRITSTAEICPKPIDSSEIVVHQTQTGYIFQPIGDYKDLTPVSSSSHAIPKHEYEMDHVDLYKEITLINGQTNVDVNGDVAQNIDACRLEGAAKTDEVVQIQPVETNDSKSMLVSEIRQFIATMGILLLIYDVTILPVLSELHMATVGTTFVMPRILNALCCLNVLSIPVVYLVRVQKIRSEMKQLVVSCCCPCK